MTMRTMLILAVVAAVSACGPNEDPTRNDAPVETPTATNATATTAGGTASTNRWVATVAQTPEGGFRMGNPQAAVRLVEYGARTCPSCAEFSRQASLPLRERYVSTGRVSYEFRDFAVHGIPDVAASLAGRCGGAATFFPILERTYERQTRSLEDLQKAAKASEKELAGYDQRAAMAFLAKSGGWTAIATEAGVPAAKVDACVGDMKEAQALVDMTNGAKEVEGTPTFLINGRKVDGSDWTSVSAALDAALR
jgi:protein-disulfide isomerase